MSYSLMFAYLRASAEAEYTLCSNPGIEYWLQAILKLSEPETKEAFRLPDSVDKYMELANKAAADGGKEDKENAAPSPKAGKDFLPALTEKVRRMRANFAL